MTKNSTFIDINSASKLNKKNMNDVDEQQKKICAHQFILVQDSLKKKCYGIKKSTKVSCMLCGEQIFKKSLKQCYWCCKCKSVKCIQCLP